MEQDLNPRPFKTNKAGYVIRFLKQNSIGLVSPCQFCISHIRVWKTLFRLWPVLVNAPFEQVLQSNVTYKNYLA